MILTIAVIYYVVQHRNLLRFRIPDRGHPELKNVKNKHLSDDVDCSKKGSTFAECSTNDKDILSYCGENPNAGWDDCRVTKLRKPIKKSTEYTYGMNLTHNQSLLILVVMFGVINNGLLTQIGEHI